MSEPKPTADKLALRIHELHTAPWHHAMIEQCETCRVIADLIRAAEQATRESRDKEWAAAILQEEPSEDWVNCKCRDQEFARGFIKEWMRQKVEAALADLEARLAQYTGLYCGTIDDDCLLEDDTPCMVCQVVAEKRAVEAKLAEAQAENAELRKACGAVLTTHAIDAARKESE